MTAQRVFPRYAARPEPAVTMMARLGPGDVKRDTDDVDCLKRYRVMRGTMARRWRQYVVLMLEQREERAQSDKNAAQAVRRFETLVAQGENPKFHR